MSSLYTELGWLPAAGAEIFSLIRSLESDTEFWVAARRYANAALDVDALHLLAKRIRARSDTAPKELQRFRLAIASNGTTGLLKPALVATGLRHGLLLEVFDLGFDQIEQAILNPASPLYAARCDGLLLALDHRSFFSGFSGGEDVDEEKLVSMWSDKIRSLISSAQENGISKVFVQTVARPPELLFGSLDIRVPGTSRRLFDALNLSFPRWLPPGAMTIDIAALAETVGLERWFDHGHWFASKLSFSPTLIALYADYLLRTIAASTGKIRKCLVLDLDNTLWGGIIGDDGVEGIVIGQGSAIGEAHLALQRAALELRGRGIILAVCSKNELQTARIPFTQHPDMLLRENHFAAFHANWTDKASNIRQIASALEISRESIVFIDDNPVERAQVRFELPEVAIPELPTDPSNYARILSAAGYFELLAFSTDDRKRAEYYETNTRRAALKVQSSNIEEYLQSLDMEITFTNFDEIGTSRIAQLAARSNQFNLTTERYSEDDIKRLRQDARYFTLQIRLSDRFGDNGMIGVVVCRKNGAVWHIEAWFMSCRVLNRGVEVATLQEIIRNAIGSDANTIVGKFIPSSKNELVREHYAKLGFAREDVSSDNATYWRLPLKPLPDLPTVYMKINHVLAR